MDLSVIFTQGKINNFKVINREREKSPTLYSIFILYTAKSDFFRAVIDLILLPYCNVVPGVRSSVVLMKVER